MTTLVGFFGANALLNKASQSKTVNKVADVLINGVKDTYGKVAKEIKIPKNISKKAGELIGKVKVPEFAKDAFDTVKNSKVFKNVADMGLKVGKKVVKYAPDIALGSAIALTLAAAVKQGMEINSTKRHLKDNQLNTARNLVESYKAENEDLKSQLAEQA